MGPGPIFARELVATARRPRLFTGRVALALGLLMVLYLNYRGWFRDAAWRGGVEISAGQMAEFGHVAFLSLVGVQLAAVVGLTPGLTSGAIAEEARRKTLHYLLASRLSSLEIVLGKLAARLLHLGAYLAVSLPVMSLLTLLGGVDPALVALAYVAMAATAFFLAAVAILASALARDPRQAAGLTHGVVGLWLIGPLTASVGLARWWPSVYAWIHPVVDWVGASSPFTVFMGVLRTGSSGLVPAVTWMIGLEVAYGIPLVLLAAWQLRPAFRRREGRAEGGLWRALKGWRWRIGTRPECGDDAMLWKEMHVSRTAGLTKLAAALVVLALLGLLGYLTYDFARPAFAELLANGYGGQPDRARNEFNVFLRMVGTGLYVIWALALVSSAGAGVTSERERDTWTSLLGTPLGGREILRAKQIGAAWQTRGFGYVMLALWGVGVLAGAVHPLGVAAVAAETAAFAWFATAVGTYFSLKAATTGGAQNEAMLVVLATNGYLLFGLPFFVWSSIAPPAVAYAGCTPMIVAVSLLSYRDVALLAGPNVSPTPMGAAPWSLFAMCALGLAAYVAGAYYFTAAAVGAFDATVGRPRRGGVPRKADAGMINAGMADSKWPMTDGQD